MTQSQSQSQSQSLIFYNPGEMDIRGAVIAGLSAKDSTSAIGYFGTGLKYAIACVLRNGGSITIWSGLSEYRFTTELLLFRDKEFKQIKMNGVDLGFTTEYGKNWEPWQIFRELYANARDENGDVRCGSSFCPTAGQTHIIVNNWEELQRQYLHRDEIILPRDKFWNHETDRVAVAYAPSTYIYFKGVRVHKVPALFTWNLLRDVTLSEDRTLKSIWDSYGVIRNFMLHHADEANIRKALTGNTDVRLLESLALNWYDIPQNVDECSTAYANVATALYRSDPELWSKFEPLALSHCPDILEARQHRLTPLQERMLDRAKSLVARMGFAEEVKQLPIIVQHLGGNVLGKYSNGVVSLDPKVFDMGTKQVVSTLYEEYTHARTGYADCCYPMQTHLFNTIVSLYEEQWGEPC